MLTALTTRLWPYIAAAGAALALLWRLVASARQSERDRMAARAAEVEQRARRAGDAAAADAERDGAAKRLRDGRF